MSYRRPERVAAVVLPPSDERPVTAYLLHLPDGEPMMLTETAALIWVLASEGDADVAASMADLVGEPVEDIRDAVEEHLVSLLRQGFLEDAP